jgi:hypothetical protein
MLQLWKAWRGRKAAVAAISPFLEASRFSLGSIPEAIWRDAYLVGFLAMLASLEAKRATGSLTSHALGLVQAEALAQLSGESADLLGERICSFSTEQDARFNDGCLQAIIFHEVLQGRMPEALYLQGPLASPSDSGAAAFTEYPDVRGLWARLFEVRAAALLS